MSILLVLVKEILIFVIRAIAEKLQRGRGIPHIRRYVNSFKRSKL